MTGPTTIGMVKLIKDDLDGTSANDYVFDIVGAADELTPKLIQGQLDMAAIPVNLASVLYNRTEGKITLLSVNTLGVLYLLAKGEEIADFEDLKGKTIYATGKGSTPEYNLRYLLSQNGIDPDKDVTLEFKSEPTEVVALLKSNENAVAMLPQPFATAALNQVEGLETVMNLTEQWDALENGSRMITGVMVVRTEFLEENPDAVAAFLAEYEASINYVNANPAEMAPLVEQYVGVKAGIATVAIPKCNLAFLSGNDMKAAVAGYLGVLFAQAPQSVGGALPADGFYHGAN
jgi:NitT/TauT family transport system substrate-binding protein